MMSIKKEHENMMDALIREWAGKIEFLMATADKAKPEQKIKYFEYIDSLQAKQQNLLDMLQGLLSSNDSQKEFSGGAE